jgi:hypothetical protein
MKRREIILLAAALVLLVVFPTSGHCGLNPLNWRYGLSKEQQYAVRDCIVEGRKQVDALSAAGRAQEAKELDIILKNLEGRTYSLTDNPMGYMAGAYAHVYSGVGLRTIHLYDAFFNILKNAPASSLPQKELLRRARLEQLSILIHEYWHTNYQSAFDFGRPEGEAYQTQYKWLRLFGVSDGMVIAVVKDQLAKNNVTPVEPPPPKVTPKPPAADSKNKGATICASYAAALQRDVAAKKNPGTQYRLEVTRAYAYDEKTNSCVGSHVMWASYNGGKWYEALVYCSPEKPAHENVGRIQADYTKKYPDLKWQ